MGVSVLNLELLNFCSKSISQSVLSLQLAPKSLKIILFVTYTII